MAGYIPNAWRATLLEVTAGKTAVSTATLYLGLATAIPEDPLSSTLSNITEVTTAGYARKQIPAFGAATTSSSGTVQITTPTQFQFDNFTADQVAPILYAFITSAASGTGAPIRYLLPLADALRPAANRPIEIPASTLILE